MVRRSAPSLAHAFAALLLLQAGALVSCRKAGAGPGERADGGPPRAESDGGGDLDDEALVPPEGDAGTRAVVDAGMREVELAGAMNFQTSILSEMDWPPDVDDAQLKKGRRPRKRGPSPDAGRTSTSQRLGYLRHGATAPTITISVPNDACPEGWFELVAGGFVCGKAITFDLKNPRVARAPRPPDMKGALPYVYGAVVAQGTPVYRRVLSRADRAVYESTPARDDAGAASDTDNPYARELEKNARASMTLEDLHGRGVLVRKLARGFILALDREFKAADAQWWRTTGGFAVPFERIFPMTPVAEPHGRWIGAAAASAGDTDAPAYAGADAGAPPLLGNGTVAFVKSKVAHAYVVNPDEKQVTWGPLLPVSTVVEFTGLRFTQGGSTFRETTSGFWMRAADGIVASPVPPEDLAPGEKWIDVDMTLQMLVAFEGMKPVFAARVSTGRRNAVDREKDFPTPAGTFRIREKHITATMDGDVASDGPYSIEDVPWVMYFDRSYALHGAFWHNQFGSPRSHGCVNMAPADAKQLFSWVEPRLPDGWHGAYATESTPGTRVVLHGEAR